MGGRRRSQGRVRRARGQAAIGVLLALILAAAAAAQTEQDARRRLDVEVRAARDAQLTGDWDAVAQHGEAALQAAARLTATTKTDVVLIALAENFIATADNAQGRYTDAVRRLERVLRERPELPLARRSFLSSQLARVFLELGLPGRAREPVQRAVAWAELARDEGNVDYGALFNAQFLQADLRMALNHYREAAKGLADFEATLDWAAFEKVDSVRAGRNRGRLAVRRGAAWLELVDEEAAAAGRARAAFEFVVDASGSHALDRFVAGTRLAFLDILIGELDEARTRLASIRAEWAPPNKKLPIKERAWLSALEARIAVPPAEAAEVRLARDVEALVELWRRQERPAGVGALRYRRTRFIVSQLLSMGSVEVALERLIALQSVGVLWRALDKPTPDLKRVRATLTAAKTGCVVFVAGQDAPLVFAFDRERSVRVRLPDHRWIEDECNALRQWLALDPEDLSESIADQRSSELDERAARLARGLFPAPVRALLEDWDEVRLVGRQVLSGLPSEVLPVADGEPLGCSHAVAVLPSLPVGVALAGRRSARAVAREQALLLLTAPDVTDALRERFDLERLAVSDRLVERLRGAFPGKTEVLRGARARASALANVSELSALQVLAHGTPVGAGELRLRIVCAPEASRPEGLLTVEDVRSFQVPELVVLSVCRSGAGAERLGDAGSTDFGGAFLMAGASTVVLSAEDVRLFTAVELSEALYTEIGQGVSVAEALRRARVTLRSKAEFADPYHWAQTYAFGLGGPLRSR